MKQLVLGADGGAVIDDMPEPRLRDGHLLVRVTASLLVSEPAPTRPVGADPENTHPENTHPENARPGFSAAGTVIETGAGLEGRFRVGQRVAIAGHGIATHAEIDLVPGALAAPIPDDTNDEEACFAGLAAIALHGARTLGLQLGHVAAVIGIDMVGQLAVQLLTLSGVRAAAIDPDPAMLELARFGGAELCWNPADGDVLGLIHEMTRGLGCDGVLIAAPRAEDAFGMAAAIAGDRARIALLSDIDTPPPYRALMQKELSVVMSRSFRAGRIVSNIADWAADGRDLADVARIQTRRTDRRLHVEPLITHRIPFEDAAAAFTMMRDNTEPHLGVVLRYPTEPKPRAPRVRVPAFVSTGAGDAACVLGAMLSGGLDDAALVGCLTAMDGCRLHAVAAPDGIAADEARQKAGFEHASTRESDILDDSEINAVLLTASGDAVSEPAVRALDAGKNVFIAGPPALTRDELNRVAKSRGRSSAFFTAAGLRFAPLVVRMRGTLEKRGGRKFILISASGGQAGEPSIGALWPYVDLARHLVGEKIVAVHAAASRLEGSAGGMTGGMTVTLNFSDGSLATIVVSAPVENVSHAAVMRERIEASAGGVAATLRDFRALTVSADGAAEETVSLDTADRGERPAMEAFVAAVRGGAVAPVAEAEIVETNLAAIAAFESLRGGKTIEL